MAHARHESLVPSLRQSCERATGLVAAYVVVRLDIRNQVLDQFAIGGERISDKKLEDPRADEGLGDRILRVGLGVWNDHHHRLNLALGIKVVENLGRATLANPRSG